MAQDFDKKDKKTILMVDDSTVYLEMMSVTIGNDYELKFATDGQKALHMLENEKDISLILLALQMPYMSGIEFLMELKKNDAIKDIPVIALTTAEDNEAACLCLGAVDYVKKKPFPMRSVLVEKIEKALNSNRGLQEVNLDSYINSLFSEYSTVFLIDAQDFSFDSFSEDENYRPLHLKQRGSNFFDFINNTIAEYVFEEDRAKLYDIFDKDKFEADMHAQKSLSTDFRLCIKGKLLHYHMKAMLVPDEKQQIMIGISDAEETAIAMETLHAFREDKGSYARVAQALAADYMCIYYVHLASNSFIEYSSIPAYSTLRLAKSGENFFTFALKSFIEGVNPIDTERVARQFTRENVLETINKYGAFTISFRLTFEDNDAYVALKATKLVNDGAEYLVVGISNIDAQMNAQLH